MNISKVQVAATPAATPLSYALQYWDAEHPFEKQDPTTDELKRALFAAWWFIENVDKESARADEMFFEVRELVRGAQGGQ
jgi:hypothetical protein